MLLDLGTDTDAAVAVVTHGGPIRAVCAQLLGLLPHQLVPVAPASLTVIDVQAGLGARLRSFNATGDMATAEPTD